MNLSKGPFQILTGGYEILEHKNETNLILSSNYKLNGIIGNILHIPFRIVVYAFQRYLLKAIKKNLKTSVKNKIN